MAGIIDAMLGRGPQKVTATLEPESVKRRRLLAALQMREGSSSAPVQHWAQGANRVLQGLLGGYEMGQMNEQEGLAQAQALQQKVDSSNNDASLYSGLSGGQPSPNQNYQPGAVTSAPMGAATDGSVPRGIRNNNFGNIEAGGFAQKQPGYLGSDGRFARFDTPENGAAAMDSLLMSYAGRGINTVGGIVGRWAPTGDGNPTSHYAATVAKAVGVDPNTPLNMNDPAIRRGIAGAMAQYENGRPVDVFSQGGAPQGAVGQAPAPDVVTPPAPGGIAGLSPLGQRALEAVSSPDASPRTKMAAEIILKREMAAVDPTVQADLENKRTDTIYKKGQIGQLGKTTDINEYEYGRGDEGFFKRQDAQAAQKRPQVNIDNRAESAFQGAVGASQGKRFENLSDDGGNARTDLAKIGQLRQHLSKVPGGALTGLQSIAGDYGIKLGDNASDLEAATAIIEKMVPEQRLPGAGPTSDADLKGFRASLPKIINTPGGNALIMDTMQALTEDRIRRGDIGDAVVMEEMSRADGLKALRALPDPFVAFKEAQKGMGAAPAAPAQAAPGGTLKSGLQWSIE